MPSAVITKTEELNEKRRQLKVVLDEAGPDRDFSLIKVLDGTTMEKVEAIRAKNREIDALADEVKALGDADKIARDNEEAMRKAGVPTPGSTVDTTGRGGGHAESFKSFADLFLESDAFKGYNRMIKQSPTVEIKQNPLNMGLRYDQAQELKTLMTLSSFPMTERDIGVQILTATRRPVVADLLPQATTDAGSIRYVEETTMTNAAAAVAEGAVKPESALVFTERTAVARKIATFIPVTDELMLDAPALRGVIDARLRLFLQLEEERELLLGSGVAPELTGLLNWAGIQTQAKGADPVPDAIYKAITKVQTVAFLDPSGVVMHPNDWQDIRLLRTADGIYIWGSPADPGPERIWGLPIVKTVVMTENTALVGAFESAAQIFRRMGVEVVVSSEHSDFFIRNQLAIRAEERLAFVVYRPTGFCTVTGI